MIEISGICNTDIYRWCLLRRQALVSIENCTKALTDFQSMKLAQEVAHVLGVSSSLLAIMNKSINAHAQRIDTTFSY